MENRAVLFDLDGTLLNTIEDLADSMNAVLKELGYKIHNIEQYKLFVGDGIEKLVHRSLPAFVRDQGTVNRCVQRMGAEYAQRWPHKTCLYAGIQELLDALTLRRIKLAILSNKPHRFTSLMVERFLKTWRFNAVSGARDTMPLKPDPTSALLIAHDLHMRPQDFLYLGDTATDMKTARNAGMYAVGVLWGFREEAELHQSGARNIIDNPLDLLAFFQEDKWE